MPSVLFVDDEPDLLSALRDYFEPTVIVRTAVTAREGLEILQQYKPDVIVSDERMKVMSGIEFLEKSIDLSPDSEHQPRKNFLLHYQAR
jgi:CheY-like chemotaxis protein